MYLDCGPGRKFKTKLRGKELATLPFNLTLPPTTKAFACQTELAKQLLNTNTSNLLSTSENIIVPTGAIPSAAFFFANESSFVLPPALSFPSIHLLSELVLFCDDDVPEWMEGSDGGKYQRSNAVVPIWSP